MKYIVYINKKIFKRFGYKDFSWKYFKEVTDRFNDLELVYLKLTSKKHVYIDKFF